MDDFLGSVQTYFRTSGYRLLEAVIIFAVGILTVRLLMLLTKRLLLKSRIDSSLITFALSIIKFLLLLVLVLICLGRLNVSITSVVTVLSAMGLALGLALQDTLSNIFNGVAMAAMRAFKVGDTVSIGDQLGIIKEIRLINTQLATFDNKKIIIPNKTVFNATIVNYSANGTRRVDLNLPLALNSDIEQVKGVISDVLKGIPDILDTPAPLIRLAELGQGSLVFAVKFWARTDLYWDVYFAALEAVVAAFAKNGLRIPYGQMDVHMAKPSTPAPPVPASSVPMPKKED